MLVIVAEKERKRGERVKRERKERGKEKKDKWKNNFNMTENARLSCFYRIKY